MHLPEVFCSGRRYAALLGCDINAVHYRLKRGTLARNEVASWASTIAI